MDGNNKHSNQYSTNSLTMNILPAHAMATQIECPAKYQIYIDLGRGKHVNHVIHNYFKIVKVGQGEGSVGICKKCDKKVFFERNSSILVEHLKTDHPTNYREGWNYSYPHYIKILGEVLFQTSTDFPEVKKDKMNIRAKLADIFGSGYSEKLISKRWKMVGDPDDFPSF